MLFSMEEQRDGDNDSDDHSHQHDAVCGADDRFTFDCRGGGCLQGSEGACLTLRLREGLVEVRAREHKNEQKEYKSKPIYIDCFHC